VRCKEKGPLVRCQEKGPLVRCQGQIFGEMPERKREVELRKETTFAEGEHASQGKEKYGFQIARKNRPYHMDLWRSYNI
jgi:hypothetical protein